VNVVVADACPVIFLAKLDRLGLIRNVFPGTILLPESVWHELTRDVIPHHEQARIREFVKSCRIENVIAAPFPAAALSLADRQVLTLAKKHRNSTILTDDRLVRQIALAEAIPVAGTLGILIRSVRAGGISPAKALQAVEKLITEHQLRISVDLYQETLRQTSMTGFHPKG
jgi:predicted nucleic acid-binding protein